MLHSIILGEGTPLVILHGFLGMADNWKTLGKEWSKHGYQVHLLDQRNHGRSLHSTEFNYTLLANDINDYCKEHDLSDIYLLGHSMGGKVAMKVATDFPNLVKKLVVADIAPKNYAPHHSDIINGLKSINFDEIKNRKEADEQLSLRIPDFGTRQFLLKSLYRIDKNRYGWRFNLDVLGNSQQMIGTQEPINTPIKIPTLFVRGAKSGYINENDFVIIEHAFAKANLKTVPDAGHWLHAEQPEIFYRMVTDFLED
ncbi:alpha/beta fold hydrolase [Nonlabens mediterrranea]|uniref:Alpha/beta fold hydrolase n=1 Tax=Nonlabens mediterrranea TaxID=1419947 RepID=A0ABS0A0M0_9FLAO|nr:putative hydrolase (alpha/beta hydrolase superfamily) [Flavobacteria bacterium BBFL7]MBF4982912.1 alpha/beta fold hydrolase [Nonlabens mediterrranea]